MPQSSPLAHTDSERKRALDRPTKWLANDNQTTTKTAITNMNFNKIQFQYNSNFLTHTHANMHVARKIHIHIQTQPRVAKRVKGIEMALQHAIARFSRGILFNPSPSHPTNRSANIASAQATANPKTPFRPPIHYATEPIAVRI